MIYEILLPLPINKTFYYLGARSSKDLCKGSLVEVEFKKKVMIGVVINYIKSTSFKKPLKEINKVFNPFFFNSEIMESINFISQYSCNQSSMILKMFLSNFPIKRFKNLLDQNKVSKKIIEKELKLNSNQEEVVRKIGDITFKKFKVILLEGVTGSGKTRVYLHKVREVINKGYQCLILVPEIILTTQWVEDIKNDFDIEPIVYHSSIKKKEREEIWKKVNLNQEKLIIGTRSALFLPFSKLGLIVIDEEHDSSYKQEEQLIINARDFSIVRAKNANCLVILSSATPSLESSYNTKLKKYDHFKLKKRVNNVQLPNFKIIDMKKENCIISDELTKSIKKNIDSNHQTLIFINKRGYSSFVICKKCGFSKVCEKCNTSLALHNHSKNKSYLLCHHCNYREVFKNSCHSCGQENTFIFPGLGIEKIAEVIAFKFPIAKKCLLSSDIINSSSKFQKIVSDIVSNKVNIIIGTQLISKGHNFPSLRTVGIINIDNLMNSFDFRSYEKTFQQIIQVGGRAGRRNLRGEVLIQTLQPDHPVIKLCSEKNSDHFVEWELISRKENNQPPYSNYTSLIFSSKKEKLVIDFSKKIYEEIIENFKNIEIFGPAPAILYKKNTVFRYKILIKMNKNLILQKRVKDFFIKIKCPSNLKLYIDVDPINFV